MVYVMHVHFMFSQNLKSSFSEDNVPGNALGISLNTPPKLLSYPVKRKK